MHFINIIKIMHKYQLAKKKYKKSIVKFTIFIKWKLKNQIEMLLTSKSSSTSL